MKINEEIKDLTNRLYYCSGSKEGKKMRKWIERKVKTLEKQQNKKTKKERKIKS